MSLVLLFLVLNRHSRSGYFNYHSEIWSDKAGYYVYLPAAFNYKFDPALFPDSIVTRTGNGFSFDAENKVVRTKYTYGVALLQLPFYTLASIASSFLYGYNNGFTPLHHTAINISALFYLLFGLFFLKRYLNYYFPDHIVYKVLAVLFLGSNLYYYSIDETGMSHVYSFALFSLFLYLLKATQFLDQASTSQKILFGITGSLIILVRPSNVLFLLAYFLLDASTREEILHRLKRIVQPKTFFLLCVVCALLILPQLIYWKYAYNSWFSYSYGQEGFHWSSPKIVASLFSPYNGLFPNTPLYFIILLSVIFMIRKKSGNGIFLLCYFALLSYILSCWWDRTFGCAFGGRSFVEHLALFSAPLAQAFFTVQSGNKTKMIAFYSLMVVLVFINIKMTYTYDGCFPGDGDWDWSAWAKLITSAPK